MSQQLAAQVKELLNQDDHQSLKYIINDEDVEVIQQICTQLSEEQANIVRKVYAEARPDEEILILTHSNDNKDNNKKIDQYLLQCREAESEKKQQTFLEMISKINQKLVYEEHFGYPFYDLFKRIVTTHGDLHPLVQSVKTFHSQVQILYSALFTPAVLKVIEERYNTVEQGFKQLLQFVFTKEYRKYQEFTSLYKNIKKSTEEEQSCDQDDDDAMEEIPLNKDETLELDEKQFLVNLAEGVSNQQFPQFLKNRSYNFLCFGLKKYLAYIGLEQSVLVHLKQKQFADILSFLTIRFLRKIIFDIIRSRSSGKLNNLKHSITPHQIKTNGNDLVDKITAKVQEFKAPRKTAEEEAKHLFLQQFQPMSYSDFINRKYISEAVRRHLDPAQYSWHESKQYRSLWLQRVKSQRYVREGMKGQKPLLQYVDYIKERLERFNQNSKQLWKGFIMDKFGYEEENKMEPVKKVKLSSLND